MDSRARSAPAANGGERFGFIEAAALTFTAGLLAGVAIGTFDVAAHGSGIRPRDLLTGVLFGAVPGIVVSAALGLSVAVVLRALRVPIGRARFAGLLAGGLAIAFAAAVILVATRGFRDTTGLLLLIASLPGAVLLFLLLRSAPLVGRPGGAIVAGWVLIWALVVGGAFAAAVDARDLGAPLVAGAGLLAAAGAGVLLRRTAGAPRSTFMLAVVSMPVLAVLCSLIGDPDPSPPPAVARSGPPNVVVIVLDTTRRDHLGAYGSRRGITPALDRLAAESVVYEDAYSTCNWTVPSHASILTGLHPRTHGCSREHHLWLDDEYETLAERLKGDGYETTALYCNVWLGPTNLLQGFDHVEYLDRHFIGLGAYRTAVKFGFPLHWIDKGGNVAARSLTRWFNRRERPDDPFFLFVNLLEPHAPYLPPREHREANLPEGVAFDEATRRMLEFEPFLWQLDRRDDPETMEIVRRMYEAEIRYLDECVERMMAVLARSADLENTMIVVVADHGENLGGAGRWGHEYEINDALIHVPLFIRYPAKRDAGRRLEGICQVTDVLGTVLAETGAGGPALDRSLRPGEFEPLEAAVAQLYPEFGLFAAAQADRPLSDGMFDRFHSHQRAYRTSDRKLVWSSDGGHRLFDLADDRYERRNLAGERPMETEALLEGFADWLDLHPAYVPRRNTSGGGRLSEEALERLRSLGYLR